MHPDMPLDAEQNFTDQDVGNPVHPCRTAAPVHHVWLLNETKSTWPKIKKASDVRHRVGSDVGHASKSEILETMRYAESGDILTWNLHTWFPKAEKKKADPVASGIRSGTLNPWGDGDPITTKEFLDALRYGTPPAVVIMCGCATHQFITDVVGAGIAVAFGVGRDPDGGTADHAPLPNEFNSLGAADAVTAALMNGDSLTEAAAAGSTALNKVQQNQPCVLIMRHAVRPGVDSARSLADNHLL